MKLYVGVGSNVEPETNVPDALARLDAEAPIVEASDFYETEAIDRPDDPPFWNGIVVVDTDQDPVAFDTQTLWEIEDELGRTRGRDPYAPRVIDLDVLLADDVVVDEPEVRLPSPEIHERAFWQRCLLDLDPGFELPNGTRVADLVPEDASFERVPDPWPSGLPRGDPRGSGAGPTRP